MPGSTGPALVRGSSTSSTPVSFVVTIFEVVVVFSSRKTGDGDGCGHVNQMIRLSK